jgi:hypothetical protein
MAGNNDALPACDIDAGTFKYVLIKETATTAVGGGAGAAPAAAAAPTVRFLVAGYGDCAYHDDIFQRVRSHAPPGVALACVGGGRIQHDPSGGGRVYIYGFSQAYGRADHAAAAEIVRRAFPAYGAAAVTWSNDGY